MTEIKEIINNYHNGAKKALWCSVMLELYIVSAVVFILVTK